MSQNQRLKLQSIANIRMGYPFRKAIEQDPTGTVGIIQMKDFTEFHRINLADIYRVSLSQGEADRHLLRHNDILFRSRGVTNHAAIVPPEIQNCVASQHLTILQIRSQQVDPGYVAWYLNHPKTQERLHRSAEGTSLMMINTKAIGEFEIEVPSLEKQQEISILGSYSRQEQELLAKLAERRKLLIDHVLMHQVGG
jgi:restriction endonuclease S subunit